LAIGSGVPLSWELSVPLGPRLRISLADFLHHASHSGVVVSLQSNFIKHQGFRLRISVKPFGRLAQNHQGKPMACHFMALFERLSLKSHRVRYGLYRYLFLTVMTWRQSGPRKLQANLYGYVKMGKSSFQSFEEHNLRLVASYREPLR